MNEFLPRSEPVASVVGAKRRTVANVRDIAAPVQTGTQTDAHAHSDAQLTSKSAAAASYAKLQADIADVVARLDPPRPNGAELARQADQSIVAMLPQPVVVLPLPPTNQRMMDFVAQVAQAVASQAAMARAAHARISGASVEAAVH